MARDELHKQVLVTMWHVATRTSYDACLSSQGRKAMLEKLGGDPFPIHTFSLPSPLISPLLPLSPSQRSALSLLSLPFRQSSYRNEGSICQTVPHPVAVIFGNYISDPNSLPNL